MRKTHPFIPSLEGNKRARGPCPYGSKQGRTPSAPTVVTRTVRKGFLTALRWMGTGWFPGVMFVALIVTLAVLFVANDVFGATFGNTTTTSLTDGTGVNSRALVISDYMLVVTEDIVIDTLSLYCSSIRTGGTSSVDLAIYRRRNGTATDLLGSGTITYGTGGTKAWRAVAVSINVSAGDTICLAEGNVPATDGQQDSIRVGRTSVASSVKFGSNATLQNPWSGTTTSNYALCIYAYYHTTGAPATAERRGRIMKLLTREN